MFFFCDRCGTRLHSFELSPGRHECDPVRLIEFQVRRARFEIDESLEARVAEWERDPRVARRVAFARYVRAHCEAPLMERRRAA